MIKSILSVLENSQPAMVLKTLSPLGKVGTLAVFILLEEGIYRCSRGLIPDSLKIPRRIIAIGLSYGLTLHIAKLAGAILSVPTSATCVAVISLLAIPLLYRRKEPGAGEIKPPPLELPKVDGKIPDDLRICHTYTPSTLPSSADTSFRIPKGEALLIQNIPEKDLEEICKAVLRTLGGRIDHPDDCRKIKRVKVQDYLSDFFGGWKSLGIRNTTLDVILDKEKQTIALIAQDKEIDLKIYKDYLFTEGVRNILDSEKSQITVLPSETFKMRIISSEGALLRSMTAADIEYFLNMGNFSPYRYQVDSESDLVVNIDSKSIIMSANDYCCSIRGKKGTGFTIKRVPVADFKEKERIDDRRTSVIFTEGTV
jgi:hypothetical protein